MLKELLKRFYFRIYFSKYYLQLSGLRKLYCLGSLREFTANLDAFYQELVQFPYLYYGQHSVQQGDELPYPLSPLPEVPMKDIYAGNKELLSEIETFVKKGISNEIPVLLNDIESFLDNVFDSMNAHKYTFNRYKTLLVATLVLACSIYAFPKWFAFLSERYSAENEKYFYVSNAEILDQKGVDEILRLNEALQKYYDDYKSYPKSSGGWDGIATPFGESKEDWIPGLAPAYVPKLPRDPRNSKDPSKQFMYKSDGTDYKVISHHPGNLNLVVSKYPELIDPVRNSWAFGVWSKKAKDW